MAAAAGPAVEMTLVLLQGGAGIGDAGAVGRGTEAGDVPEGVVFLGEGRAELGGEGLQEGEGALPNGGDLLGPGDAGGLDPERLQRNDPVLDREGNEDAPLQLADTGGMGEVGDDRDGLGEEVGGPLFGEGGALGPAGVAVRESVAVGPPEQSVQVETLVPFPEGTVALAGGLKRRGSSECCGPRR